MLFNSYVFLAFFAAVFALYWGVRKHHRAQNLLLLVSSYVFYGYWDYRFLFLIALSTVIDFLIARELGRTDDRCTSKRRALLWISIAANLGILGFFKYYNFFADSLTRVLASLGFAADPFTLNIVLPVGISFYTFQTLSYTIDVYRKRMPPAHSFLDFAVFVSFFPQLVAGPIERASHFLPQIQKVRRWSNDAASLGLSLIIWGYFKKVVIADNMSLLCNPIFESPQDHSGFTLFCGLLAFALQIYGDFSGYTDIARGISKLMGFDLMLNFRLPYLAASPSDFWQRWHISLSSWLRDYLYIPLGGNRLGSVRTHANLLITMLLGGLWHGASWNFVLWGLYHGLLLIAYRTLPPLRWLAAPMRQPRDAIRHFFAVVVMFGCTLFGWLLFRCHTTGQIAAFISGIRLIPDAESLSVMKWIVFYGTPLVLIQAWQAGTANLNAPFTTRSWFRILLLGCLVSGIMVFGVRESSEFLYFQF